VTSLRELEAEDYPSMKFFIYSFTIRSCSKHAD